MKMAREHAPAGRSRSGQSCWPGRLIHLLLAGCAILLMPSESEDHLAHAQLRPIDRIPPDQQLPRRWEKLPRPLAGVLFEKVGKSGGGNVLKELKTAWPAWPIQPEELEAALLEQQLLTEALITLESCPLFSAVELLPTELCMLMEDPSIEPGQSSQRKKNRSGNGPKK